VKATSAVLVEIGWRWTNRQPTWFTSWYKRVPARLWRAMRRLARRPRRRSVTGRWELARFLARTVEPAAVVLWASTLLEKGELVGEDELVTVQEKSEHVLPRLDRLENPKDAAWVNAYLDELAAKQPRRRSAVRLLGWLGVSRWRAPAEPTDRVSYNLACFFSRLAAHERDEERQNAHLNRSADYLGRCLGEWGLRRGEAANWAWSDPGLDALKTSRADDFEKVVGREAESRGDPVDVPSIGNLWRRQGLVIAGWALVLVGALVAVALFAGVPFG